MFLKKTRVHVLCDAEIPHTKGHTHRETHASLKVLIFKNNQHYCSCNRNKKRTNNLKTFKCPIESRMDKYTVMNSHTGILYIALKMHEYASAWMNITNKM